jgi:two-component system, NarL family, invasion response regulator UvrY
MDVSTRIAIAAEHPLVASMLRSIYEQEAGVEVVLVAPLRGSQEQLVAAAPELIVVETGTAAPAFDLVAQAGRDLAKCRIAVLCLDEDVDIAARYLRAGAQGVFLGSTTPEELVTGTRAIIRGEMAAPPQVVALLSPDTSQPGSLELSSREFQVLELLAQGWTNREIADHLRISIKTVDTHRGHVLKKLRLRNNSDLTRFAVKHGYVPL